MPIEPVQVNLPTTPVVRNIDPDMYEQLQELITAMNILKDKINEIVEVVNGP